MHIPHMAGEKPNKPLPYLLLIPVMLFLAVFTFFPFFRSIYLSFFITDQLGNTGKFVGFGNYIRVFKDRNFINSVKVTLKFAVMVCTGTFSLAMLLALLCVNPVKGSKIYQTMFALPIAVASVSVSAIFKYLFQQSGLINNLLGTNINWLADASYALPVTAFVTVWSGVGTSFIFLLVGFRNVPDDLIESSVIDGANAFQRAVRIMIPIASPQIFFVLFLHMCTPHAQYAPERSKTSTSSADPAQHIRNARSRIEQPQREMRNTVARQRRIHRRDQRGCQQIQRGQVVTCCGLFTKARADQPPQSHDQSSPPEPLGIAL